MPADLLPFRPYARQQLTRGDMSPELLFRLHLVPGYVTRLLCFGVYVWPRLKSMDALDLMRGLRSSHAWFRNSMGRSCGWRRSAR
ncbi:hypothetical protein BN2476_300080 [Paraburkholderia piptadeniae]|uniref:Uncharacterized protein n=1 Tax=Paraburkholderia piptadeniae TaxID=1701573 RepID=A0A1N7S2G4_9BURK|nr:hypothetical protein BN2476_300080 [Paraburkholderia piptadeniae]